MNNLKKLNEQMSAQIQEHIEAMKLLEGYIDNDKLNAYISGMQFIQNMVIDAMFNEGGSD